MRCEQFAELVWDLVRPSVLPEGLAAQARLHAADCAACARLLAEAELLQFGLKTLAQQVRSRRGRAAFAGGGAPALAPPGASALAPGGGVRCGCLRGAGAHAGTGGRSRSP